MLYSFTDSTTQILLSLTLRARSLLCVVLGLISLSTCPVVAVPLASDGAPWKHSGSRSLGGLVCGLEDAVPVQAVGLCAQLFFPPVSSQGRHKSPIQPETQWPHPRHPSECSALLTLSPHPAPPPTPIPACLSRQRGPRAMYQGLGLPFSTLLVRFLPSMQLWHFHG